MTTTCETMVKPAYDDARTRLPGILLPTAQYEDFDGPANAECVPLDAIATPLFRWRRGFPSPALDALTLDREKRRARAHEIGHAWKNRAKALGLPIESDYWGFRGFSLTWDAWRDRANATGVYSDRPDESIADCFAAALNGEWIVPLGVTGAERFPEGPLHPVSPADAFAFFARYGGTPVTNPTHIDDPAGYLLGWPVTRLFGDLSFPQFGPHTGIDIAIARSAAVPAVKSGIVTIDDDDAFYDETKPATWSGVSVWITDDDGEEWIYAHMARNTVMAGQRVLAGDVIGFCGSTGAATGPHLHLERRVHGIAVDPYEEVVMLSNTALAQIREVVADEVGKSGRSIETKLDSGFNVTLVGELRRAVRHVIFAITGRGYAHDPAGDLSQGAPARPYADDTTPLS